MHMAFTITQTGRVTLPWWVRRYSIEWDGIQYTVHCWC